MITRSLTGTCDIKSGNFQLTSKLPPVFEGENCALSVSVQFMDGDGAVDISDLRAEMYLLYSHKLMSQTVEMDVTSNTASGLVPAGMLTVHGNPTLFVQLTERSTGHLIVACGIPIVVTITRADQVVTGRSPTPSEAVYVAGPYVDPESKHWIVYSYDDGRYVDSGINATGIQGPQGPPGVGPRLLGAYDTYEQLATAHPTGEVGDAYIVNQDVYIWVEDTWYNCGRIIGPVGPTGPQGPEGREGKQGPKGNDGSDADVTRENVIAALGYTPQRNDIPNNYAYDGRDLRTVFASAAELHNAVAAGDFSKIRVGDYWPVTLSGTYKDYGDNTDKTINTTVLYEVAGINIYMNYGDTGVGVPHVLFCPRNCLPNTSKWRSADTTWYNTGATNPWLGSAIYATLNNGLLPIIAGTDIGAYIYGGPNGKGMRVLVETKAANAANATSWAWVDRGKLFLPFESEIFGRDVWSEHSYGSGTPIIQWPIFAGSYMHIIKDLGNGGSRYNWWQASSCAGSAGNACYVGGSGIAHYSGCDNALGVAPCFLLV